MVAVGPITQATDEEMAVALGTVSVLNSVALFIFPAIGAALKLSQSQFGLWAALAIHDTSSVVGAAAKCRTEALADVDHGEASPRPVDCSFDRWDGRGARREGENSVALVYRSFLPGSGIEYVSAGGSARLCDRGKSGEDRFDRDIISDRQRHLAGDGQARGASSAAAGNSIMLLGLAGSPWLIRIGWIAL
jgi:hypothetical protein